MLYVEADIVGWLDPGVEAWVDPGVVAITGSMMAQSAAENSPEKKLLTAVSES